MPMSFTPLSLSEAHRRRRAVGSTPFFGAPTGLEPVNAPKNEEDTDEVMLP